MLISSSKYKKYSYQKNVAIPTNRSKLATHTKKEAKATRTILDSRKDHFISHVAKKKTSEEMLKALVGFFQSSCVSQ